MIENSWLKLAEGRINNLIRICKEESMKSIDGKIDFNEISYLLNGSIIEIQKLMIENHQLKEKLEKK